jgi:hypothetical protein
MLLSFNSGESYYKLLMHFAGKLSLKLGGLHHNLASSDNRSTCFTGGDTLSHKEQLEGRTLLMRQDSLVIDI